MIGEEYCAQVLHMTWKNIQLLRIKNELVKRSRVSGSASPTTFPVVKVEKKASGLSCIICTQAIWSLFASFLAQYAHLERICTAYLSIFVRAQRTFARKIFSSNPPIYQWDITCQVKWENKLENLCSIEFAFTFLHSMLFWRNIVEPS